MAKGVVVVVVVVVVRDASTSLISIPAPSES